MLDCILDGVLDTLKLLPYLFITFLILELIEHKISKRTQKSISKHKRLGPILGGIIGGFPQCGFSAMASNLYTNKLITTGTLIAIFLSTSDEMIPIMLGKDISIILVAKIIAFKIVAGIVVGLIVDLIFKRKNENNSIKEMCDEEKCHCKKGILLSSVIHTLKTVAFILIANLLINIIIYLVGEETLSNMLNSKNIWVYFVASLIGLIPNCAASIVLTEVYISGIVSIGITLSGLLTGSGIGILLLFKNNKNIKENLAIMGTVYSIGVLLGIIVDLII